MLSREAWCLEGAHIRDATEWLPGLIKSTDYYSLLLFLGASDTAMSSPSSTKKDYRTLGVAVKAPGVHVAFSSILLIKGKGFEEDSWIWRITKWLQDWCHSQGFGYIDHGIYFEKTGLLGTDGVHLSEKGGGIFGHRLAKLVIETSN